MTSRCSRSALPPWRKRCGPAGHGEVQGLTLVFAAQVKARGSLAIQERNSMDIVEMKQQASQVQHPQKPQLRQQLD